MSVNIKKAFTFPFEDIDSSRKLMIGGLFFLSAFILNYFVFSFFRKVIIPGTNLPPMGIEILASVSSALINVLMGSFAMGYILQSTHNEIKQENSLLPEWRTKLHTYFGIGIKYYLITFAYGFIIFFLVGFLASLFTFWGRALGVVFMHSLSNIVISIILLLFLALIPFITVFYAKNFNMAEAFSIRNIFHTIANDFPDYFLSLLIIASVWVAWTVLHAVLRHSFLYLIISPFVLFIIYLITLNLFAQTYRYSTEKV